MIFIDYFYSNISSGFIVFIAWNNKNSCLSKFWLEFSDFYYRSPQFLNGLCFIAEENVVFSVFFCLLDNYKFDDYAVEEWATKEIKVRREKIMEERIRAQTLGRPVEIDFVRWALSACLLATTSFLDRPSASLRNETFATRTHCCSLLNVNRSKSNDENENE